MSGTVMAGISRSKEDQNNKVEDNQKGEDLGVDIINGENKKKKKNPKKILLEKEGTLKTDPSNQEIGKIIIDQLNLMVVSIQKSKIKGSMQFRIRLKFQRKNHKKNHKKTRKKVSTQG